MPTAQEAVRNVRLSGLELKEILRQDFARLLDNECLLSAHIAFGRVSYRLKLELFIDNPHHPRSGVEMDSRRIAGNLIDKNPSLAAIEVAPLHDPSPDALAAGSTLSRKIDSPNAERIRHGLPLKTLMKAQNGMHEEKEINYPADDRLGEGDVRIEDTSAAARDFAGMPQPPSPLPVEAQEIDKAQEAVCRCSHTRAHHALSGICTQCKHPSPCESFIDASRPEAPAPAPQAWPIPK